jgi:hypothetical protein
VRAKRAGLGLGGNPVGGTVTIQYLHVGCKTAWGGLFRPISVRVFFVIFWRFEKVLQVRIQSEPNQPFG